MTAYRVIESSGSNGSIQFAVDGDFSSSGNFVFVTGSERLGVGTSTPAARLHVSGSTIFGGSASDFHQITGSAIFATGLTGSLTQLPDGRSYLVAGDNVTIVTGSNGQITISAAGSGGSGHGSTTSNIQMSWMETPAGVIDGLNSDFTLAYAPSPPNALMLYVNGVLQSQGLDKDFTLSSNTVSLIETPSVGDQVIATYSYVPVPIAGSYTAWMEIPVGPIDGVNNNFTLANSPYPSTALMLYYNGVLQRQGMSADYVLTGGKNITINFVPEPGSNIQATYPY